jgi:hypothetical protein
MNSIGMQQGERNASGRDPIEELLLPAYAAARDSSSLVSNIHVVTVGDRQFNIPQLTLLGPGGGASPLRIALFAGLEPGALDSIAALTGLLVRLTGDLAPARGCTLIGFPIVNVLGLESGVASLGDFESRYAATNPDGDVRLFKDELRTGAFDGLVKLRTAPESKGFYAIARGWLIANKIAAPAVLAASEFLPLLSYSLRVRSDDEMARLRDAARGRLVPPLDIRPYPFEIELFAPGSAPEEQRITGQIAAVLAILDAYRALMAHAQNL